MFVVVAGLFPNPNEEDWPNWGAPDGTAFEKPPLSDCPRVLPPKEEAPKEVGVAEDVGRNGEVKAEEGAAPDVENVEPDAQVERAVERDEKEEVLLSETLALEEGLPNNPDDPVNGADPNTLDDPVPNAEGLEKPVLAVGTTVAPNNDELGAFDCIGV